MTDHGAYRYVNKDGDYAEWKFDTSTAEADTTFTEELLDVEIFEKMAVAKIRHVHDGQETPSYKVMLLHKLKGKWKNHQYRLGYWGNTINFIIKL